MEKKYSDNNRVTCRSKKTFGRGVSACNSLQRRVERTTPMKIFVSPTTGGCHEVCVSQEETVRGLKKILSKKFKIPKDRLSLLCRDRLLINGSLRENNVQEESRLVLCPNMESGNAKHNGNTHSFMRALQNLTETQVNSFLSGQAPLTLAIRFGEHMMFVHLQLSTSQTKSQISQNSGISAARDAGSIDKSTASSASSASTSDFPQISAAALAEASRNLTKRLQELTHIGEDLSATPSPVLSPSMTLTPPPSPPPSPGAVIDSMQHLGKGVYSGTFSGVLDPRLQDGHGRPRRDVNTILHILHDLLVAQPASPRSPNSSESHFFNSTQSTVNRDENAVLRDKMQRIQTMLEERRLRRSVRRENQRPYPRTCRFESHGRMDIKRSSATHLASLSANCSLPVTESPGSTTSATTTTSSTADHAAQIEAASYCKPNMEHETVAV